MRRKIVIAALLALGGVAWTLRGVLYEGYLDALAELDARSRDRNGRYEALVQRFIFLREYGGEPTS